MKIVYAQLSVGASRRLMILGYSILAVPTGIVSAELVRMPRSTTTRVCPGCYSEGHHLAASFCRDCGIRLAPPPPKAS